LVLAPQAQISAISPRICTIFRGERFTGIIVTKSPRHHQIHLRHVHVHVYVRHSLARAGSQLGDYIIEAEIGGGGMARVYRARHNILETVHALKVLDPVYRAQPEARKRFLEEARIQAKHLGHPGIVRVTTSSPRRTPPRWSWS